MKKIHFSILIFFTCIIALSFNSCSDDEYDLGNFVINLATVNPIDKEKGTYYLTMDDGTTLWPAASNVYYKPKENQRVLMDFTLLSDTMKGYDYFIRVNRMQDILTKDIIELTPNNEAEIGHDPVKILEYWIGDHYLNIHFGYNTGGEKSHNINMIQNGSKNNGDTNNESIIL